MKKQHSHAYVGLMKKQHSHVYVGLMKKQWEKLRKRGLIWFSQLSIIFFALIDDNYSLLMICRSDFDPHKLLMT